MRRHLLRGTALLTAVVALAFLLFFQFTVHDPVLAPILPFYQDPFDAVTTFGVIAAGLLSLLSVVRARRTTYTYRQSVLLARTQVAVAGAVFVTLGSDGVAMLRYLPRWMGRPGDLELVGLVSGLFGLALLLWLAVRLAVRDLSLGVRSWRKAAAVSAAGATALALFPESLTRSVAGTVAAVATGMLALFAPLSTLPGAFLPFDEARRPETDGSPDPRRRGRRRWAAAALVGVATGIALLVGEWSGEGLPAPGLRVLIASLFVGAATVGLLAAYWFLRGPLGLDPRLGSERGS
ncbi:MAG: hypothetical protein Q8W51_14450 [Candidatus Palauibacterales bacterium]|nr:hypothetical protein [Candidatus Palauibacterales bacterium]